MNSNYVFTKNIVEKMHPSFKGTTFGTKRYLKKNPQHNSKLNPYENILKPTTDYVSKVREFLNQQKELGLENTLFKNNDAPKNNLEDILELLEKLISQSENQHKQNLDIMNERDNQKLARRNQQEHGEGVKIYKDPRPVIKKSRDSHKKLLKQLDDMLKTDIKDYKKAKGVYAKGMSKGMGAGVYGAGFFSSIGNIFKNVIGKVVSFGKNLFTKPGALQKAVNTGIEVFKTGKDLVQNIKDKQGINAISNIGKLASNASNIRDIIKDNSRPQEMKPQDKMARNEDGMGIKGGNTLTKIVNIRNKNKGYGNARQYV